MHIHSLSLRTFRNHADSALEGLGHFTLLTGPNGAGKTNVLEALSLLAPGRGLRRARLSEMAMQAGPGGFAVAARGADLVIGTGTTVEAPDRRQVRINGAGHPANELARWLTLIWLTPAMDRLFIEGAAARRRFADRLALALSAAHADHASRYEAAMRERNRLLSADATPDSGWLDALETRMAEHGAALNAGRAALVAELNPVAAALSDGVFARPALALEGRSEADLLAGAEALRTAWRDGRRRDRAAGRTLIGPHRADLAVTMRQSGQPAALCSTGEQKALLIAIVLAHADLVAGRAAPPLLLLDEIAAHLDPDRRAALFGELDARGGQVFMTGTDAALFAALPSTRTRHFAVEAGAVRAA